MKCCFSRIAILKEHRGKGIGKLIVEELEKLARSEGVKEVYLESQVTALGFYEKLGFESFGEVYVWDNIENKKMKKKLE